MTETSDSADRTAEIIAEAKAASLDTEDKLGRMRRIKKVLIPDLEQEYEALRDQMVASMEGPRHFIDAREGKLIGFVVRPDKTVLHDELMSELDPAVLEKVAPRKYDRKALAREMAGGRISSAIQARIMTIYKGAGTAHVRFIEVDAKASNEN